jgi:tetratricopeptide (TPR) repeat protein
MPVRFVLKFTFMLLCSTVLAAGQAGLAGEDKSARSTTANSALLSPQELFRRAAPSVMVVESLDTAGNVTVFGSGVVVMSEHVATNRHVVREGVSFKVEHNGKTWPAKLLKVDPDHDLAELFVAGLAAPPVRIRPSSTLAVGEKVYAIGAPEGLELTVSEGLISGLRDVNKDRVIQTSAAISPGSSGGGLFDVQGRLVGITTFYLKEGQSLNFALPAEWTLALERLPEQATPPARAVQAPTSDEERKKAALAEAINSFRSHMNAGETLSKQQKYFLAIEQYEAACSIAKSLEQQGVDFAYQLGEAEQALTGAFDQAQSVKPPEEKTQATERVAADEVQQQSQLYSQLIQKAQDAYHDDPRWDNANLHNAVRCYKEAFESCPKCITAPDLVNLGDMYLFLSKGWDNDRAAYEAAEEQWQKALKIDPNYAKAKERLGYYKRCRRGRPVWRYFTDGLKLDCAS